MRLGLADGNFEGSLECTFVGLKLGTCDGFEDGPEVGWLEGKDEGNKEGFDVGSRLFVGSIESVGFDVGK